MYVQHQLQPKEDFSIKHFTGCLQKSIICPVKQATASLPCNIIKLRFREVTAYSFPWCLSAPQAPILPGRSCRPVSRLSHSCIKQCMALDAAEVTRTKGKLISLSQSCFHTWELQSNLIHKLQFNRSTLLWQILEALLTLGQGGFSQSQAANCEALSL